MRVRVVYVCVPNYMCVFVCVCGMYVVCVSELELVYLCMCVTK